MGRGRPATDQSAVPSDASNLAARAATCFLCRPPNSQVRGGTSPHQEDPARRRVLEAARVMRLRCCVPWTACSRIACPQGKCQRVALGLGADVPYFLDPSERLDYGDRRPHRGRGWRSGLLRAAREPRSAGSRQPTSYAAWDARSPALTPVEAGSTMPALARLKDDSRTLSGRFWRICSQMISSRVASELCPEVLRVYGLETPRTGFSRRSGMSGSGATVFGVFPDERSARSAMEQADFEAPFWAQVTKAGDPKSCWGVAKW